MGGENAGIFDQGLYEAFFNSSADLFCVAALDGRILKASPAWGAALGYAPETLAGRQLLEIVHPEDRDAAGKVLEGIRAGGTADHETRCVGADGAVKWLRCRCCADAARGVFYISASDITARRNAEEALAASESTFRRVLDAAPMAIAVHDRSGKVEYVNARFTRVFGYERADIPDKDRWAERAAPDPAYRAELLERWTAAIRKAAAGNGEIEGSDYRITCKDGAVRTAHIFGVLTGGKAFVLFDDITDRAEAERRLRESEATLRKILELAPMSMAIVNINGTIEYINRKAVETFGYVHSDIPDMDSWWAKAYPDEAYRKEVVGRWMDRVREAFEQKTEIKGGEYRVTCKDRSIKTCYIFGVVAANKVFVMFDDITARVNTERALRESEAALRRVLDNAPIAMGILSTGGRIEYLNRKFTQAIGYTAADIRTYEDWVRLAGIDDEHRRESTDRWLKAAAKAPEGSAEIDAGEFRTRCKDGSLKVFYVRAVTIENRTVIMFDDVTGRVQAEEALRENERNLRRILEQTPMSIAIQSLEGRIEFVNSKFTQTFGYRPEEIPDLAAWTERAYPDKAYREQLLAHWAALIERSVRTGEEMPGGEYRVTCRDGSVKTVYIFGVVTKDRKVICLLDDVTGRAEMEKALRESESRYRALVETTRTGYVIINKEGRVLDANTEYVRLTGRKDLKEILGRSVLEWTAPHEKERNAAAVAQCARDGYIWDFEIDYIAPEGRLIPIEINASVVTREGVPQIATLCRDISARRKEQEEIRGLNQNLEERVEERTAELTAANEELVSEISQRMKAERAKDALQAQLLQAQKLEAVGRLAGGIAHDFNNILVSISGYAELLRDTMPQGSPASADLSEILLETERGAALTKQLLTFSAKQEIKLQAVDLNEAAGSSEKMLRRIIGSNIHLNTELAPDLRRVQADPSQVSQVIINLVINARDAMPNGGKIFLATRNVRLEEAGASGMRLTPAPGNYAELAVSDNGGGMSPETLEHIFEPFFTTKKPGQGTGLGLSTIYGIMSSLRGGIAVESAPGKGTSFRIYFPVIGD